MFLLLMYFIITTCLFVECLYNIHYNNIYNVPLITS